MKLLYTDRGTIIEEQYLELKEAGISVESFGVANYHSGNISEALAAKKDGKTVREGFRAAGSPKGASSGMDEGGASTRRAIDDEEIQASIDDFGDIDSEEEDTRSPGGKEGSVTHLGVDDTSDDIRGHEFFMDDDEEEEWTEADDWLDSHDFEFDRDADEREEVGISDLDPDWNLEEELQHSQTANIDMMSPVVKESSLKALKTLIRSVVLKEQNDASRLLSAINKANTALYQKSDGVFKSLVKQGIPGNEAMKMVRSMERSIENLAQDLQMTKDVGRVKKKAAMAIAKNKRLADWIPQELGGTFIE